MHKVALIRVDHDDWASQLKDAIGAAARRNTGDSSAVQFADTEAGADLVLCFGSPGLIENASARAQIGAAVCRGVRVLPLVSALSRFKSEVPVDLHPVNGMAWGDPSAIAEEVLRHLGLTERDRRVFLSYLRRETTPLAHQLFDELHRRRFSVFLDTFEIEHGQWVQNRIEQALQQTSFVLLLYSRSVETSEWIEKEINFALAQGLGLLAVALPDAEKRTPFRMTPQDRCVQLEGFELKPDGCLTPEALDRVCLEIDREHADQFRSRRERIISDLAETLGKAVLRVGSQSLRYAGHKSSLFIRLTPRPPEVRDLYLLDEDCPIAETQLEPPKRVIVGIKGGYRENRAVAEWVCARLKHPVPCYEPQAVCSDPGILED